MDNSLKHTSVVITPLLTIINEQVHRLNEMGIKAYGIFGALDEESKKGLHSGDAQVIFITPECAAQSGWRAIIRSLYIEKICQVAVDECHCFTNWGLTFRTTYRRLPELLTYLDVPFTFLTATATTTIQRDVMALFRMQDAAVVAVSPNRPDIHLESHRIPHGATQHLTWLLDQLRTDGKESKKTIVFCTSISDVGDLYEWAMVALGLQAYHQGQKEMSHRLVDTYHAKSSSQSEERVLSTFSQPDSTIRLVFSTIKLGMGVDIPDVEQVVLYGVPSTVVDLWQEIGRCARSDGITGTAYLYVTGRTLQRAQDLHIRTIAAATGCFRDAILEAFLLRGISWPELQKSTCKVPCLKACKCDLCTCCNKCSAKCPCYK